MNAPTIVAITGLIGALAVFLGAVLPYLKTHKGDQIAIQSGAATETRAGIAQAFEALTETLKSVEAHLDNVQEDNRDFRIDIREFKDALRQCAARVAQLEADNAELRQIDAEAKQELAAFRRRFGDIPK